MCFLLHFFISFGGIIFLQINLVHVFASNLTLHIPSEDESSVGIESMAFPGVVDGMNTL